VMGQFTNFVLFNILEPILPAKPDHLEVAQAANVEGPK